jgi:predicted DNA-binding transcriptional regulator AlpA
MLQCNKRGDWLPVRFSETLGRQLWWYETSADREVLDMYDIPETGFLRLPQVLSVIPLGKTCWWEGVKSGRFPKPIKLSARCTAWRAEEIRALITHLSEGDGPAQSC